MDLVSGVVQVEFGLGFVEGDFLVWLEDCVGHVLCGECVRFAASFEDVVEDVVFEVYGLFPEICQLDPFVVSVFAFRVGEDFGDS